MLDVKKFKIKDLFDISTGSLLKIKEVDSGNIPRISAKSDGNGILGYYATENIPEARHAENFISVNFFGNAFYHPYKASLEMKVHCLKLKEKEFTEEIGLYLTSALNKVFSQQKYSYGEQLSSSDLKNKDLYIELPVDASGRPDWEYMTDYVNTLEADYVNTLDAYLRATGLDDYELTIEDEMILKGFFKDEIVWKNVTLAELGFKIHHGKRLTKNDRIPGSLPLITAGEANQGVADYIANDWPVHHNAITVDMFGNCFYHDGDCTGDDNIYFFTSDDYSEKEKEFIAAVISKTLNGQYSYANQFRQPDADNLIIRMPFNPDGSLAREYIYIYIYEQWRRKQSRMLWSGRKNN